MRRLRPVVYFAQQAWIQLVRDRSLTSTAILANLATFFVSGLFLLIAWNLRSALDSIRAEREVQVFLHRETGPDLWASLGEILESIDGVTGAMLVTPDEALGEFERDFGESGLAEALGENPLPPTYRLELAPEARSEGEIRRIAGEAEELANVEEVSYGGPGIVRVERKVRAFTLVTTLVGLLAALSGALIIMNTSRLTILAREELVRILEQIGASDAFVRWPFLLEGIMQGVVASAASMILLFGIHAVVSARLLGVLFFSASWLALFIALGGLLGAGGAFVATIPSLRETGPRA